MSMKDKAAVVGVGFTPYYRRGQSLPQTELEMACKAILAALDDAGLTIRDLDGFAIYSSSCDPAVVGFGGNPYAAMGISPSMAFSAGSGLMSPGNSFALLTRRHMELYGTKREHLAEVAISQRENAIPRETALQRVPLTLDDYFNARMISDPLCLFDYTMETDGAVAVITTSAERARDLRHPPVYIMGSANGGMGRWGSAIFNYFQQPDEYFASSGHRPVAQRMYDMAGVTPQDVDVALLYDHFSPLVIMQLEDYGFCKVGEGGPFVEGGNIRFKGGSIPVNTHGGQGARGPARRPALRRLRHIRAAAPALLLRVPGQRVPVGRAAGNRHDLHLYCGATSPPPEARRGGALRVRGDRARRHAGRGCAHAGEHHRLRSR
jgi:acetyl-CoA acetyltransferase